jgi:two-component system, cell cycle sensor histidine kinase and response regulator CckA
VIDCASPLDAEALVAGRDGRLDLLLTDVVMPGMNGRELWRRVKRMRPSLACLMMSGYAHDAVAGMPDPGVPILQKPFSMTDLVDHVRAALGVDGGGS